MDTVDFGRRVRRRREQLRLTQQALGVRIGVSGTTIQKIESGGRTRFASDLAKALDVPLAWLETGDPELLSTSQQSPEFVGYWPFEMARLRDFELLPPKKKRQLDMRLADFIAGALDID